jgi:acyl-CoA dehydrogenase
MSGALDYLTSQSVAYANERTQFGKPIGKFQAIQQQLAVLSTQSAAAGIAAAHACAAADKLTIGSDAAFEIAVAKVRADDATSIATSIAHQVHGAIGFTYEHGLHFATRRLWSWRSEFGSGAEWADLLGRQAMERGADELWPYVTGR